MDVLPVYVVLVPAGHALQVVICSFSWYVPYGHLLQGQTPLLVEYFPALQMAAKQMHYLSTNCKLWETEEDWLISTALPTL